MKNTSKFYLILLLVSAITFYSCEDDKTNDINPGEVITEYLKAQNMDLSKIITNADGKKFVMGAPADGDVSGKYVMDIRNATDFATSRIAGAVNVAFPDILAKAADATKPILVVCYTGQTACYATALLRLYGYSDAQALKWGMSGWSPTTDSWTGKIGNAADGNSNWTYDAAPSNQVYDLPSFTNLATEGSALLKERVELVVSQGFKTVKGIDVLTTPANYHINNYFSEADYAAFGHIKGAYRIQPLLLSDNSIKGLDPDAKVVTYCYTGQTSAVITAYLRVLGYDAYSMTFGVNGLFNSEDSWTSNQWGGDSKAKDLPVVQ